MSSVCPSVRLSVTLVYCDYIGWNSPEIISPLVSLGCSLSADPNNRPPLQGKHSEILAQSDPPHLCWFERRRHSIANCGRIVIHIAQWSLWRAYRKPPSLFRMMPSLTQYDLLFSQNWGTICFKIREWSYLRNGWSDRPTLHVWFWGRVFKVGGSNSAISGYIKSNSAGRHLG